MSTVHLDHHHTSRSVSLAQITNFARSAGRLLSTWARRAAHRREMRELLRSDYRLLRDVGIRREDVIHEAFKAFWRE